MRRLDRQRGLSGEPASKMGCFPITGSVLVAAVHVFLATIFLFLLPQPVSAQSVLQRSDSWLIMPIAILQGLDKITARVSVLAVGVEDSSLYGTLVITVRACRKRPPTEPPESAAFLEVFDQKPGEPPVALFSGWMFASSPTLNALEHPVYDVWLLDCKSEETKAPPSSGKE
jgi:hypothetical protein